MLSDGLCHLFSKSNVMGMKCQETQHRREEILDVFGLILFTSANGCCLPLSKPFCGPFAFELKSNPINGFT